MSNMSYCRFENTLRDLQDCANAVEESEETSDSLVEFLLDLSDYERRAALRLFETCRTMGERYEELVAADLERIAIEGRQ